MVCRGEIRNAGIGNLFGFSLVIPVLCILHQFPGQFVIHIQVMIGQLFIQPLIRDDPCKGRDCLKLIAGRSQDNVCDLIYSDGSARNRLAFWRVDLKPQRSGMIQIYIVQLFGLDRQSHTQQQCCQAGCQFTNQFHHDLLSVSASWFLP